MNDMDALLDTDVQRRAAMVAGDSMDFVVVVTFETTPERHVEAFKLLDEYIDSFLRVQPGFIESRLNEREDGQGYLHFARWAQESDFRAFAEKAQNHPLLPVIRKLKSNATFYSTAKHYLSPSKLARAADD